MIPPYNPPCTGFRWSGCSECGPFRKNNEDAFLGVRFNGREVQHLGKIGEAPAHDMDFAFAVSDGMGGALAGEFASRVTTEKLAVLLPRTFRQAAAGLQSGFTEVLEELFDQIHRSLTFLGNSYEECAGMEATLSLCWMAPGWLYFGHVGDSRIYYLQTGADKIKQLSHDDTYVGWLLRHGQINEREARTHPRRSILQKALGAGNQFVEPQVGSVGYEKGDIFLLCSDGLVDGLYDHHLVDILRSPSGADSNIAENLVKAAIANGSRDNSTALVIEAV